MLSADFRQICREKIASAFNRHDLLAMARDKFFPDAPSAICVNTQEMQCLLHLENLLTLVDAGLYQPNQHGNYSN